MSAEPELVNKVIGPSGVGLTGLVSAGDPKKAAAGALSARAALCLTGASWLNMSGQALGYHYRRAEGPTQDATGLEMAWTTSKVATPGFE